jgi:hypothetical protein
VGSFIDTKSEIDIEFLACNINFRVNHQCSEVWSVDCIDEYSFASNSVANHGVALTDDDNKSSNEKATQAYRLFGVGKEPLEVAIELNLRQKEASKFFREFWKLKRQYRLYQIYPQIEPCIESFLKLHKTLKKRALNSNNVEWFAEAIETGAIETGAIKIPEIQKQYTKVNDELEAIDYKKTMAKYQLDNINNQITYLNKISFNNRNEIAYLKIGVQELEGYVHGLGK